MTIKITVCRRSSSKPCAQVSCLSSCKRFILQSDFAEAHQLHGRPVGLPEHKVLSHPCIYFMGGTDHPGAISPAAD